MDRKQLWPGWNTVRTIGTGGFGKVYEICKEDTTGEYRSALKVITIPASPDEYKAYRDDGYDDASITSIFKSQIEDVVSEYKLMAQFKGTSNIVSYEDHMIVPHDDGRGWDIMIRMELLTSLPEYYTCGKMTDGTIVKIGVDICKALELCSKRNIIHRDIKPQNIFRNEFGDFKLGDFGVAKAMDHTTRATKIGTYSYMAPEIYQNQPYSASADMYSLGLVLYWLLNERRLPFIPLPPAVPTAAENTESQMRRLSGEKIPAPQNGTTELKNIVLKACSFKSEDRYQTPEEFRIDLEKINIHMAEIPVVSTPPAADEMSASDNYHDESENKTIGIWDPTVYESKQITVETTNEPQTCPYCNHGKVNVFHRTHNDEYWSVVENCTVCNGTGSLQKESAKVIVQKFNSIKESNAYKNANRNCVCCGGIGLVRYARSKNRLHTCPNCTGKKIVAAPVKPKKKWIALLLSIFPYTGVLGINRIYEGNWPMFAFTFFPGLFYGGWIYSIIETARRPKNYYPTNFRNDTKLSDKNIEEFQHDLRT